MACFWEEGRRYPTFEAKIGHSFHNITCNPVTCLCNGTGTGYVGCQSCCCTLREIDSNYVGDAWLTYKTGFYTVTAILSVFIICVVLALCYVYKTNGFRNLFQKEGVQEIGNENSHLVIVNENQKNPRQNAKTVSGNLAQV